MKNRFIPLYVICFILTGIYTYAADIEDGFWGLKWETNLAVIDDLLKLSQNENVGYYFRRDEMGLIYNVKVGRVIYGFYKDKFFAVYFKIKNRKDFDTIREFMIADYSAPRAQLRVNQTIYIWERNKIKIKMKHHDKNDTYKLAYYYTPLSSVLNESRLEQNVEQYLKLVPTD